MSAISEPRSGIEHLRERQVEPLKPRAPGDRGQQRPRPPSRRQDCRAAAASTSRAGSGPRRASRPAAARPATRRESASGSRRAEAPEFGLDSGAERARGAAAEDPCCGNSGRRRTDGLGSLGHDATIRAAAHPECDAIRVLALVRPAARTACRDGPAGREIYLAVFIICTSCIRLLMPIFE